MKKLESINSRKFEVSEQELTSIKGGYDGGTYDTSYEYYYTYVGNTSSMDQNTYDICRDW